MQSAWQPLTARGIAAFARASFGRLLLVQLVFAFTAAASVVWFLHRDWFPVISKVVSALPAGSEIRGRRLNWTGASPECLAENRFLSVSVDLRHEGQARSPAHLQLELGASTLKCLSMAGFLETGYPAGWRVGLSQAEAEPWWGAWSPAVLAFAAALTVVSLLLSWGILAAIYMCPAYVIAFIANRELTWPGSWRLAAAALLPGALFLMVGIWFYGFGVLDLLLLGLVVALHLLLGWGFVLAAIWRLPGISDAARVRANPFAPQGD
jgi:hypothetical protein